MKEKIYIPIKVEDNKIQINDKIINNIKENQSKKIILEVIYNDFMSFNIETQEKNLLKLNNLLKQYKLYGIKITSYVDSIDKKNLKILKKFKVKEIELLIESSNDYILKHIGADYKFSYAKKVIKQIKFLRFKIGIKLVIGLPESTVADDLNTVKQCLEFKPIAITIIPCQINYNKTVRELYDEDEYEPLSKVQLIERLKESINLINKARIKNIIIGEEEQTVDNLSIEEFRKILASDIWYDRVVEMIKSYNVKVKAVEIEVNEADIEVVKGINDKNLNKLKEVYDVELQVSKNNKINPGEYKIQILKTYTDFLEDDD